MGSFQRKAKSAAKRLGSEGGARIPGEQPSAEPAKPEAANAAVTRDVYRVEYVPLSTIEGWPRNPKLHAKDVIDASIQRFGFVAPLILDENTKRLVAGHGRLESLLARRKSGASPPSRIEVRADGEWLVPVVRGVAFADEREAEGYLLADNRPTELGGWDEDGLKAIMRDLSAQGEQALLGIGWSPEQVADLLAVGAAAAAPTGQTPEQMLQVYARAEIKQVVLYFNSQEYDDVIRRLGLLMEQEKIESHSQLFMKLLAAYESSQALTETSKAS